MRAMLLEAPKTDLKLAHVPIPAFNEQQVLIQVHACGICRTDLHIMDGELPHPSLPLIMGHQIVGVIKEMGSKVTGFKIGDRIGVPWLGSCCGHCRYCKREQENLCEKGLYTGYQLNGGFAEYCVAHAQFCFSIPSSYTDIHAAPLLCAGLIGYRAFRMAGTGKRIGFYGFGSAAHLLTQVAIAQQREVFAFTRKGDKQAQEFALTLGAHWTGHSEQIPPVPLDSAIIFAPIGSLVPLALQAVDRGGTVVCAGIHMSDIPSFPYHLIYHERVLRSVANLTRQDGLEFLSLASQIPLKSSVKTYSLENTNQALKDLREGRLSGSAVILIG